MLANSPGAGAQGTGENLMDLLLSETGAAFAIDVRADAIVAANSLALQKLGLRADTPFPYSLDSAMPALTRLRHISTAEESSPDAERFAFWIEGRRCPLLCVAKPNDVSGRPVVVLAWREQAEQAANLDQSFVVHDVTIAATAFAHALPGDTADHGSVAQPSPVHRDPVRSDPVRSDAETLKAIARAIREGRPIRHSPPEDRVTGTPGLYEPPPARATGKPISGIPLVPATENAPSAPAATFDQHNLAELAHELKTPLGAIVAAAEIMRDERLGPMGNEKYLSYASDVHDSANHAIAVIARMAGAGRDRASVQEPAFAPVDLNAIAARVVSLMLPLAKSRGLTLELETEHRLAKVLAGETAIRQIVLNLLTNALKFTPRDGDVRVVTGYLNDGGVFLVVRDTGIGMAETVIEAALLGLGPGDTKVPRAGGGLGLGLPLVRSLVLANQAKLEIDSAPGKGTVALVAFDKDRVVIG